MLLNSSLGGPVIPLTGRALLKAISCARITPPRGHSRQRRTSRCRGTCARLLRCIRRSSSPGSGRCPASRRRTTGSAGTRPRTTRWRRSALGAVVLEAGCGEGYGADRIAQVAGTVVGLDYDAARGRARGRRVPAGARRCAATWPPAAGRRRRRRGRQPAGDRAPLGPARLPGRVRAGAAAGRHAADHHAQPADVLAGPNRPMNPFHHRELDPAELTALLDAGGFEVSRLLGLRHGAAAAPAGQAFRLGRGRAAGRAAGDLARGAAPGGGRGSGRPTSCWSATTWTLPRPRRRGRARPGPPVPRRP